MLIAAKIIFAITPLAAITPFFISDDYRR